MQCGQLHQIAENYRRIEQSAKSSTVNHTLVESWGKVGVVEHAGIIHISTESTCIAVCFDVTYYHCMHSLLPPRPLVSPSGRH